MKNTPSIQHFAAVILAIIIATFSFQGPCFASQAGKDFNEADAALNTAYKQLLNHISSPEEKALLVESQRAWIKYRDASVAHFAMRYPESKGGLFFNTYLVKKRTAYLKSVLTNHPDSDAGGPMEYQE